MADIEQAPATVRLELPADTSYAALVRAALAALAAQHGFSLDRIEDLRLAGSEAFAITATRAVPDAVVTVTIIATDASIEVTTSAAANDAVVAKSGPGSLGWTLLTSLVDQLAQTTDGDAVAIWLRVLSDQQIPVPPNEGSDADVSGAL